MALDYSATFLAPTPNFMLPRRGTTAQGSAESAHDELTHLIRAMNNSLLHYVTPRLDLPLCQRVTDARRSPLLERWHQWQRNFRRYKTRLLQLFFVVAAGDRILGVGAGDGNRTHRSSLGSLGITIRHPCIDEKFSRRCALPSGDFPGLPDAVNKFIEQFLLHFNISTTLPTVSHSRREVSLLIFSVHRSASGFEIR